MFSFASMNKDELVIATHTENGSTYETTASSTYTKCSKYNYPQYFKHHKGGIYYAFGIKDIDELKCLTINCTEHNNCKYESTFVLYVDEKGNWWLRPLTMFENIVSNKTRRFTPI